MLSHLIIEYDMLRAPWMILHHYLVTHSQKLNAVQAEIVKLGVGSNAHTLAVGDTTLELNISTDISSTVSLTGSSTSIAPSDYFLRQPKRNIQM